MNFDFTAAMNDPEYDEHLRDMHEAEAEIDRAYDAMGQWATRPDLAVASHPARTSGKMSRRERREAYRAPVTDRLRSRDFTDQLSRAFAKTSD